ncbi:MAG: OmpA family protein [Coxiellaceae bacterium]|nr:OmpA family protein [Coxiellaceae bacterium]
MRSIARRLLLTVLATICVLGLTACHKGLQLPSPRPYTGSTTEHYNMLTELHKQGVGVIEVGSTLTLILPTDCFFLNTSTEMKPYRKRTMILIAKLVKTYPQTPITVSGHTDIVYTRQQQQKNSFYYARAVAAYLWNHGVSMRYVRVIPDSAKVNVSTNKNPRGAADNRRVEIYIGLKGTTKLVPTDNVVLTDHK